MHMEGACPVSFYIMPLNETSTFFLSSANAGCNANGTSTSISSSVTVGITTLSPMMAPTAASAAV
eukprot:1153090-Pelagomonas_calceolata.AAC.6